MVLELRAIMNAPKTAHSVQIVAEETIVLVKAPLFICALLSIRNNSPTFMKFTVSYWNKKKKSELYYNIFSASSSFATIYLQFFSNKHAFVVIKLHPELIALN